MQPLQSLSSVMQSSVDSGGNMVENSRKESQPSVELGLGVSPNFSARNPWIRKTTELGFTCAQLSELYRQTLVSNFIAARHPLPPQLAIPIHQGVSSVGIKYWALDSENMMDSELNQCRRTDGKKWRCRNTVIPNERYCENHKNRGRQCSRKPVELPNKETPSVITVSGNSNVSNETPLGLPIVTGNSSCSNRAVDGCSGKSTSIPEATVTFASGTYLKLSSSKEDNGFVSSVEEEPMVQRLCSIGGHVSTKRDATAMLGCSPTSPPQVIGGNGSGSGVEQHWRCQRNDGKSWRCSLAVLPNHKYCGRHIDRVVTKSPADLAADSSKLINTNHLPVSVTPLSQRLDEYNRNTQLLIQSRLEIERAREVREQERLKRLQDQEEQFIMSQNLSTMNPMQQKYWERKQAAIYARYEMQDSQTYYEDYISEISSLNQSHHEHPPNN